MLREKSRIPAALIASALIVGAVTLAAAATFAGGLHIDQAQRDLTRVLSEVYHRAISHATLGEVARPEFASTTINLSVPDLSDGWTPSCAIGIEATPSDPNRNLQALVLVPRDRIAAKGAEFIAFVFVVGDPVVTTELLEEPPEWLKNELGGYASLAIDLDLLTSQSNIAVHSTTCPGFSYSIIEGTPK